jgi:TM2 domain-containing membrane protein YozV
VFARLVGTHRRHRAEVPPGKQAMTSVVCPSCGCIGKPHKEIPIGAKVQCRQCDYLWRYGEADSPAAVSTLYETNGTGPEPGGETTRCPFCGEEILGIARKCKHCGEFLDPALRVARTATYVTRTVVRQEPRWSPGVAAVLSLLIPGAGQMYKGHVIRGLLWLIFVPLGYVCLVVPGLLLHAICIILAASGDPYS